MAKVESVTVEGSMYSADGRTLELRDDGDGYQVMDAGRVLGPVMSRDGALESIYAILCRDDASVPGSDANWRLKKSKRAAEIAAANARWSAVMATCGR